MNMHLLGLPCLMLTNIIQRIVVNRLSLITLRLFSLRRRDNFVTSGSVFAGCENTNFSSSHFFFVNLNDLNSNGKLVQVNDLNTHYY